MRSYFIPDLHTHSTFSTDGEMSMKDAAAFAYQKGLLGIGFSDHFDIDYVDMENDFHVDFPEYFKEIDRVKAEMEREDFHIFKAIEIGLQPHVLFQTAESIKDYKYDYIIGSVHIVNRQDVYMPYYYDKKEKKMAYAQWLACIHDMIHLYYDFDILGHFDYVVRKAPYEDNNMYYADFGDIIDEILKFIIRKGIALEINTSTYRKATLDETVLKRYKELGGEYITFGSDAHYLSRVGENFDKFGQIAKNCGFDHYTYFSERQRLINKI